METLKEEVNKKLSHIFHDIKDLQRTVIHLREGQRKAEDAKVSNWLRLGKDVSSKWTGPGAVEEIRDQREKRW